MSQVVTVFEADSPLGGSVCRALAQSCTVHALIRNGSGSAALTNAGIQVFNLDYSQPSTISQALSGANACFVITTSNYQASDGYEREVQEGKLIADACAKSNVGHVVYSTQLSVVDILGIRVRHMDAKAKVEAYMQQLGLPLTSVIVPSFYENLLMPPMRPYRVQPDGYYLEIPMGHTPLNMISVEDVGMVVLEIINRGRSYLHKTLSISGDKLVIQEIAALMSRALDPKFFKDKQITPSQLRAKNIPGADDIANMFDFFCRVDQRCSVDLTKQLYPGLRSFKEWLFQNRNAVDMAMNYPDSPQEAAMMAL